ncbi:MAG: hypothetical protein RL199_2165 [Pseudomonadota bacterium]
MKMSRKVVPTTRTNAATAVEEAPSVGGGQVPALDARTRKLVERSIVKVNALVAGAGERYEEVADHLFETFYDGDVQRALGSKKDLPPGCAALLEEADGMLHLGRTMLSHAFRIGAVNRRLTKTAWSRLGWTVKTELLRALGPELSFERVLDGATLAVREKSSVREVRQWVDMKLAADAPPVDDEATASGPAFKAGQKALDVTAALGKAADRRKWVARYLKLSDEAQADHLNAVKASARNLEKYAQELASATDDG